MRPLHTSGLSVAARLARNAAGFKLDEVAAVVGVAPGELRHWMTGGGPISRGRCAQILANSIFRYSWVELQRPRFPPWALRVAATAGTRGIGPAGWECSLWDRAAAACPPRLRRASPAHAASLAACPPLLLHALSNSTASPDRAAAATNPSCLSWTLRRLAADPDALVRSGVANHPGCPPDLIPGFADDTSPWVRANIAKHPACPQTLIEHAAHDEHADVRVAVAESGRCSTHLLGRLVADEDKAVRDAAKRMLSQLD